MSYDIGAWEFQTVTSTLTVSFDGLLLGTTTKTASFDGLLLGTTTKTASLDGLLLGTPTKTASLGGLLQTTVTKSFGADAELKSVHLDTANFDSLLNQTVTKTASLDGLLFKSDIAISTALDGYAQYPQTTTRDIHLDVALSTLHSATVRFDARVAYRIDPTFDVTAAMDAVLFTWASTPQQSVSNTFWQSRAVESGSLVFS